MMKKGWKEDKLKDLCKEIFSGGTPDTRKPEYWDGELNWLSSGETRNKFIKNTEKTITQEGVKNSSTRLALKNDLVMACAGQGHTRGQVSICLIDTYVNQSIITMRTNNKVLSQYFLFYHLSSKYQFLRDLSASNSIRGSITCPMLGNLDINHPEIDEQQKIATTLSNYDNLIENNTKRIKILENIAKLIYEEWFVKFKFPGHEKVKFIDSELGKIPEGWEVKKLGDKIKVLRGKTITRNTITHGEVPVVAGGLKPAYHHNKSNAKGPVITISASGANAGFTRLYFGDIWASDCSYVNEESTSFVYYYYSLMENRATEINALQRGSAQPHVYAKDLMRLDIIDPKEELIINFEKIVKPIFKEIACLTSKNQNLSKTRDLLLPRLITGKVDVSELDIQVEVEA
jgi:type I restriction enzyme S subunit